MDTAPNPDTGAEPFVFIITTEHPTASYTYDDPERHTATIVHRITADELEVDEAAQVVQLLTADEIVAVFPRARVVSVIREDTRVVSQAELADTAAKLGVPLPAALLAAAEG